MNFEKDKIYKFGILSDEGNRNPASPFPEFKKSPKPVAMAGKILIDNDIRNFSDYLEKNIHNYPPKDIVQCYLFEPDASSYKKLAEGNPFKRESVKEETTINDRLFTNPDANTHQQPITLERGNLFVPRSSLDLDGLQGIYQRQIEALSETIQYKENKINELINKQIELINENGRLEAELRGLEIENDKLSSSLETLLNREKESNGLSDGGAGTQIVSMLMELATDPNVRSGITNYIKSKFGGGQQKTEEPKQNGQQPLPSFDKIGSAGNNNQNGQQNVTTN